MKVREFAISTAVLLLSACASAGDGPTQTISIYTNAADANCNISRNGQTIHTFTTPRRDGNALKVDKSSHDLIVRCSKPGQGSVQTTIKAKRVDKPAAPYEYQPVTSVSLPKGDPIITGSQIGAIIGTAIGGAL